MDIFKRLWSDLLDLLSEAAPLIVALVFLAAVFGGGFLIVRRTCFERAALYEMEVQFGFFQGCAVYTEQGWRDIDSIRQLDE